MNVFVHIGYPKTGTTWLQELVFSQDQNIAFVGHQIAVREFIESDPLVFDPAESKRTIEIAAQSNPHALMIGISYEGLSGLGLANVSDAKPNADKIKWTFPNAKIVIGIRNQVTMARALYSEYLRGGGIARFSDFMFHKYLPGSLSLFSLDNLKYDRLISYYQALFGRDRVFVYLFEDFVRDKAQLLTRLYDFLDLPLFDAEQQYDTILKPGVKSSIALELLRLSNYVFKAGYLPLNLTYRYGNASRNRILRFDRLLSSLLPIKLKTPAAILKVLEEEFHESNAAVSKLVDCDLRAQGYPVG